MGDSSTDVDVDEGAALVEAQAPEFGELAGGEEAEDQSVKGAGGLGNGEMRRAPEVASIAADPGSG